MFISHYNHTNLLPTEYGRTSIFYITLILFFFILISIKRKDFDAIGCYAGEYFCRETSKQLKGFAVLILLLGHLELACVDGRLPFSVDEWAVIIFLFVSAMSLCKTYGFDRLGIQFLSKRLKRLMLPTWLTLFIFLLLDFLLLDRGYSIAKILLLFAGVISPGPPNGPMWFVSYIIFLYLLYFALSFLDCSLLCKILIFWAVLYFGRYFVAYGSIFLPSAKHIFWYFKLWGEYSIVYPFSILIGMNYKRIFELLDRLYCYSRSIYTLTIFLFLVFFLKSIHLFSDLQVPHFILLSINSIYPVFLVFALIFIGLFLDKMKFRFVFLSCLGEYSFEIFLVHLPFMVYYDFFLYRTPLILWFFIYFFFIVIVSILLSIVVANLTKKLEW